MSAITGATTCATLAMRFTPPIMTSAMSKATTVPMTQTGTPKLREQLSAMPLHCTGGRKMPQATAASTANRPPKKGDRKPCSM